MSKHILRLISIINSKNIVLILFHFILRLDLNHKKEMYALCSIDVDKRYNEKKEYWQI